MSVVGLAYHYGSDGGDRALLDYYAIYTGRSGAARYGSKGTGSPACTLCEIRGNLSFEFETQDEQADNAGGA